MYDCIICKKKCLKCNQYFSKKDLYYHQHYDKYYKTYWCKKCLENHYNQRSKISQRSI